MVIMVTISVDRQHYR